MKVRLLPEAEMDLGIGADFYEAQNKGLGGYFITCLVSDIESLKHTAGIHPQFQGLYRVLSKKFPFALYYRLEGEWIEIISILDCRQDPKIIQARLRPPERD